MDGACNLLFAWARSFGGKSQTQLRALCDCDARCSGLRQRRPDVFHRRGDRVLRGVRLSGRHADGFRMRADVRGLLFSAYAGLAVHQVGAGADRNGSVRRDARRNRGS